MGTNAHARKCAAEKFSVSVRHETIDRRPVVVVLSVNGGLSPRQECFARLFEAHGWQVRPIVWDRGGGRAAAWTESPWAATRIAVPAPVSSVRILFALPRYLWSVRKALRAMAAEENSPSAIVATHPFHLVIARCLPAIWVYDACEYFSYDFARYFGPFAKPAQRLFGFCEGRLGRGVAAVLAVDSREDWLARRFSRRGRPVKIVWNVPAGHDEPPPDAVARAAAAYQGKTVIAYAGGLVAHKGIGILLETFARVVRDNPGVMLLLIGPAADPKGLRDRIAGLGIADRVVIREPMGYSAMLAHLKHAAIGMALFQEDYRFAVYGMANSRKIFTYMQAGLAIVATDRFDLGKAVRDSQCGVLLDAEDSVAVARALNELLNDPDRLQALRDNARHAFESEWNWERIAPGVWTFLGCAGIADAKPW